MYGVVHSSALALWTPGSSQYHNIPGDIVVVLIIESGVYQKKGGEKVGW